MKMNKKRQQGATMITWLIVAGLGILMASAVVKVAPYYIEFNNVKGLMKNIAGSPNIKTAGMRQINNKIEKHLNINNLYALEKAYYASKTRSADGRKSKNPFKLTKIKKSKDKRKLTVAYDVPVPWIGNLAFLIKFKHSVILGEPDTVIEETADKAVDENRRSHLNLN